jgi:2',3'-cyclic-nucleotide 2'-phosphodiesterase (5'-nucleotidase family)
MQILHYLPARLHLMIQFLGNHEMATTIEQLSRVRNQVQVSWKSPNTVDQTSRLTKLIKKITLTGNETFTAKN